MVFDKAMLQFSAADFPEHDWHDFYGDVVESIPPNHQSLMEILCSLMCLLMQIMREIRSHVVLIPVF